MCGFSIGAVFTDESCDSNGWKYAHLGYFCCALGLCFSVFDFLRIYFDANETINAICICSDPEVSKKKTKNEDSDLFSIVE